MTLIATKFAMALVIVRYPLSTIMFKISVINALVSYIRLIRIAGVGSSKMYLVTFPSFYMCFFFKMFFRLSINAILAGKSFP
jgi:hypothetical protein